MRYLLIFLLAVSAFCQSGNVKLSGNITVSGNVGTITSAGGGGTPTFGGAATYWGATNSNVGSIAYTLTNGIASGCKAVLLYSAATAAQNVASVADDAGNTWTLDYSVTNTYYQAIASATITSPLSANQHITVTYGSTALVEKIAAVFIINNATSYDTHGLQAYGFAASVSAPATVAANSVQIGNIYENNTSSTYTPSGSGWSVAGAHFVASVNGFGVDYYYNTASSAGSVDPSGTVSAAVGIQAVWGSYK